MTHDAINGRDADLEVDYDVMRLAYRHGHYLMGFGPVPDSVMLEITDWAWRNQISYSEAVKEIRFFNER